MTPRPALSVLMAVPMYPPPVVGGLEKQAHELARALVKQGHRVLVLSGRHDREHSAFYMQDGVEVHRTPWFRNRWLRFLLYPWILWGHFHALRKIVDVVHCHVFSGFGLYLIVLAKFYGKPVLVKLPNVGIDGLPGLQRRPMGKLLTRVFRCADAAVAMSNESQRELADIGFDARRVLCTPNGICIEGSKGPRTQVKDYCRFVFVGRLDEQKGLLDLLDACRLLGQRGETCQFTLDILGTGPLRRSLEARVAELGPVPQVRMLGMKDSIASLLLEYDCLVLPSYREGNSNAILEAMAAGLPIISTRVGGTAMLVGDPGAVLLHTPGDVPALAELMHELACEPMTRLRVGSQMQERVRQVFDITQIAQRYARAYELLRDGKREQMISASACLDQM